MRLPSRVLRNLERQRRRARWSCVAACLAVRGRCAARAVCTWGRMAVCTCGIMGRVRLVPVIMHRVRRVPQMLWRRVLQVDPERLVGMEGNDMVFLDIEIDGADAGRIEVLCPLFSPLLSLLSSLISPLFPLPEPAAAAHKSTGPAACGKGSCMEARAAQRETGLRLGALRRSCQAGCSAEGPVDEWWCRKRAFASVSAGVRALFVRPRRMLLCSAGPAVAWRVKRAASSSPHSV